MVSNTKRGRNNFSRPTAIRILVVLRVRIGWGKSPDDTLECSREVSEGASVLLLTRTVWNEDVMLRVYFNLAKSYQQVSESQVKLEKRIRYKQQYVYRHITQITKPRL